MVGAGRHHVAGGQRVNGTQPLDATRNVVRHVVAIEFLHYHAVVPKRDSQLVRIRHFVGGYDIRPHGRKGIARFHLEKYVTGWRQAARGAVDKIRVAEDVLHRIGGFHVGSRLADDDREFRLTLEHCRRHVGQHHGIAVADHRVGRLVKGVNRRGLCARAVFHVVHRHAIHIARRRQRRANAYLRQRNARAAGHRSVKLGAIRIKALNQTHHQAIGREVRNVFHHRRNIHHVRPFDDAHFKIIKKHQLHLVLLGLKTARDGKTMETMESLCSEILQPAVEHQCIAHAVYRQYKETPAL